MALPRLNESPEYELTIPSMGKKVSFRPFLVKEQKVLLIAFESKDKDQILKAMLNTIKACVELQDIDVRTLPTFDIDYMFTQIRAKSVGETTNIMVKCDCESKHENKVTINLNDVKVPTGVKKDVVIPLTDTISIGMKYPTYSTVFNNMKNDTSETQVVMNFLVNCIDTVQMNDELINMNDETYQEKTDFIESLNSQQFQKLTEYLNNVPQLTTSVSYSCEKCGKDNVHELKGLEDFFL